MHIESSLFKIDDSVKDIRKARSKDYYSVLVDKKVVLPTSILYWETFGQNLKENVLKSLDIYRKVTRETYLLSIQFKIIHNVIATNKKKYDWKIEKSFKCHFCSNMDTVYHYFWDCQQTKEIVRTCLDFLNLPRDLFTDFEFLFGKDDIQVDNVSILITYMIYSIRQHKKVYHDDYFAKEIEYRFMADKNSMPHEKLNVKWALIKH